MLRIHFRAALLLCSVLAAGVFARPADAQTPASGGDGSLLSALRETGRALGSEAPLSALAALSSIEVATAPLGTSAGGFTYEFDSQLKIYKRSVQSYGPAFAQRSVMTGKGGISVGLNWLHANYDSLGGIGLRNGEFRPAKNIQSIAVPYAYSGLSLKLASDTVVGFAQMGVTNRLDVGVMVPWVQVRAAADGGVFLASGERVGSVTLGRSASSGVGDVGVFGKYLVLPGDDGGLAAAFEVRLPSGDKEALRGLNVTRTLVSAVWSRSGRIAPHVNVGYEFWSRGVAIAPGVAAKNTFRYAAGAEFDVHPQITAVVDVIGRQILSGGKLAYQPVTNDIGTFDALTWQSTGINSVAIASGVKWNFWRNTLATVNVLTTVSNGGLRAHVIPVVGIERTLGKK
jgi:hypothetical protein